MSESNDKTSRDSTAGGLSRPMYYGGTSRQVYYGGSARPMYYGGGGSAYGGVYGGMYGGGAGGGSQEEDSMIGSVTLARLLRVCLQRWITIVVFIIVGLLAAFTFFKMSPTVYEAVSVFRMTIRRPTIISTSDVVRTDEGNSMEEVFNTRLATLRSRAFFQQLVTQYRATFASAQTKDETLCDALEKSKMELIRRSQLVRIAVRSTEPQLAMDLANLYLDAVGTFTSEQNKLEAKDAVKWLQEEVEKERRKREGRDRDVLDYRAKSMIDLKIAQSRLAEQTASKVNLEISELQGKIAIATALRDTLEAIKEDPVRFGELPEIVPRSSEIAFAFKAWQEAIAEKNARLIQVTIEHPEVKALIKKAEAKEQEFGDAVYRALETSKANLVLLQRQLNRLEPQLDELMKTIERLELDVVVAKQRTETLVWERDQSEADYQALLKRMRDAEYAADEKTATIKSVEPAILPEKAVLPQPAIIFSAGPFLGLLLGILFVLIVDHLEDKIVGISDIEQRLRLKTLVVLPHVRRMKREQIAHLVDRDKFSQFAEAIASLRNLLDSPRYTEMSKVLLCVSTQPAEGKTVTSCNLAVSCALSGQKTLLIDFDMRRPRVARIFEKADTPFPSLPHTLAKADTSLFPSLPVPSGVENLDLVCSRASSEISPASLMGSGTILEFFKWARENYDRVIVDSPPFGVVGDVMTLSSLVDAVMIMCCPQRTRFNPLKHAARHLAEAGARVIGAIVNDVDFDRHRLFDKDNYHYKYAYHYGKKYGYASSRNPAKRSKTPATAVGSANTRNLVDEEEHEALLQPPVDVDVEIRDTFDASMVDDDE